MRTISLATGLVCLLSASRLFGQDLFEPSAPAVSLYQLSHKPCKEARRLFDKGAEHLKRQDLKGSVKLFRDALAIDPRFWDAENNLGYAYIKLAQPVQAQKEFQRAVEIDPQNAIGYANLSVAALNQNDYRAAEKYAREALRLDPVLPQAKGFLGLAEVGQGHWTPEAHRFLEEGYKSIPGATKLLQRWPSSAAAAGPDVVVIQGILH